MQTNLNTLKWVTDRDDLFHNLWYAYGDKFKLICPAGRFIPFQIKKDNDYQDITSFTLRRLETGDEFNVLSEMENMGLYVDRGLYENYPAENLASQSGVGAPIGASKWGFSIGNPKRFQRVRVRINPSQNNYIARIRIKTSSDGETLVDALGIASSTTPGVHYDYEFIFNSVIENTNDDNLWLEISANGPFYPVGRDDVIANEPEGKPIEQDKYGTGTDINTSPTIDAPSDPGNFSGYTQTFGAVEYETIIFPCWGSFVTELENGMYEAEMSDGNTTWISEPFCFVADADCFPKITYWQREDWDVEDHVRVYENGYRDWFYPYSQGLIKPGYPYEQQAQNKFGREYKNWIVSYKEGRVVFPAPEWLFDALRVLPMMDDVIIEYAGKTYDVDYILPTPTWGEQGHLMGVECVFRTGFLRKLGNNLPALPDPLNPIYWGTFEGENWGGVDTDSDWEAQPIPDDAAEIPDDTI